MSAAIERSTDTALRVCNVTVSTSAGHEVVSGVSFALASGDVLGLAGESGCGKSTLALALLGYCRAGLRITAGQVFVNGRDLLALSEHDRRRARGRDIAYVSQDASAALNPSLRVRRLVQEVMTIHGTGDGVGDVRAALRRVHLPDDDAFLRRFPHQLSGGQQQRLAIGIALACKPSVLVLDEPTTGLDVLTQARLLEEIRRICLEQQVTAIFVSHDLAAMAAVATRIAVLYAGRIVEDRPATQLIREPKHPYTAGLIGSVPIHTRPEVLSGIPGIAVGVAERPPGCAFAPRCALRTAECEARVPDLVDVGAGQRVRCIHWEQTQPPVRVARPVEAAAVAAAPLLEVQALRATHGRGGRVVAADDVSFRIAAGECVALVGESGSGKSTIARCVAGLHAPAAGHIALDGVDLAPLARDRTREQRHRMQIVFQNPYDSLNPSLTVEQSLSRPLELFGGLGRRATRQRVAELLSQVRLPSRLAARSPRELSGGERQRVAIARALAAQPDLLICDEVTSSLDVSVQAAVLELLGELELALLFITHDLGVVASIADRVLVLQHGQVSEEGHVDMVLRSPRSEYSQRLIDAIPELPVAIGPRA